MKHAEEEAPDRSGVGETGARGVVSRREWQISVVFIRKEEDLPTVVIVAMAKGYEDGNG